MEQWDQERLMGKNKIECGQPGLGVRDNTRGIVQFVVLRWDWAMVQW